MGEGGEVGVLHNFAEAEEEGRSRSRAPADSALIWVSRF